jgi:riboflavin synthase alpha subunit
MQVLRIRLFLVWLSCCISCIVQAEESSHAADLADILIDEIILDLDEEAVNLDDATGGHDSLKEHAAIKIEEEQNQESKVLITNNSLDALSDDELRQICIERGFDITADGEPLTHVEYVEAATRCLSLEDEMNAILAENPDLAAELEMEIERMAKEKERLQLERDAMLAEKAALEEQLRQMGIDPRSDNEMRRDVSNTLLKPIPNTENMSVEDTLRTAFVMLFDRVGQDMRIVGRVLRMALKPAFGGVLLVWRYSQPSVEGAIKRVLMLFDVEPLSKIRGIVAKQLEIVSRLMQSHVPPALRTLSRIARKGSEKLSEVEQLQMLQGVVGAVLGPLRDSLLLGWKSVQPDLQKAKVHVVVWWKRLYKEIKQAE